MTESNIFFDSWACWEVMHGSAIGRRLRERYLDKRGTTIHISAMSFGEIAAKLVSAGHASKVDGFVTALIAVAKPHDVDAELSAEAGHLRSELRRADPSASLTDAVILASARRMGATLISNDGAFRGQPDVVSV